MAHLATAYDAVGSYVGWGILGGADGDCWSVGDGC